MEPGRDPRDGGLSRRGRAAYIPGMSRTLPSRDSGLPLKLREFLPYRLAVLAEAVSRSIAQVYSHRFDLSRDEWRVLAALAETGTMKTRDTALYTTLDKMQVSRAVAGLEDGGLIETVKVGRVRTCSIRTGALAPARDWMMAQRLLWEGRLDRLEDYLATMTEGPKT